jgi:ankyrin repeat protein
LHWACFAGSDTAIYYLQSWGSQVNAKDNVGNTPLHLAIRSADHFPNTRSIKELLIKGASRDIKEKTGLRPIDLVDEVEDETKRTELKELLKDPGFYMPCF